ncbi:MAG TPA: hypothetical protein VIY86_05345, partial [Pirellulaceae bacterium]
ELRRSNVHTPASSSAMALQPPSSVAWSLARRRLVSAALIFHLFALVIAPASNPPPASQLSQALSRSIFPYLKFMSLDNGYRFFAPDPGPSHLVRYEVVAEDGSTTEGTFPDRNAHWPRLLYHRYFMIAEMMHTLVSPLQTGPAPEQMTPAARKRWSSERAEVDALPAGVARDLFRQHPQAHKVRLYLREHLIPSPFDLDRGVGINDAKLFQELPLGEYPREPS